MASRQDTQGSEETQKEEHGTGARRSGGDRGFAAMAQERQRAIASQGGRAAHRRGVAHEFNSEEARAAGRKGGEVVSQDRRHMATIGAIGGRARAANLRARARAAEHASQPGGADVEAPSARPNPPGRGETGGGRRH